MPFLSSSTASPGCNQLMKGILFRQSLGNLNWILSVTSSLILALGLVSNIYAIVNN